MSEEKNYTLQDGQDYADFIYHSLHGQASEETIQLLTVVLELVITELQGSKSVLNLALKPQEIEITIAHDGRAIKQDLMQIIDDQVSRLHYLHLAKDRHILTVCCRGKHQGSKFLSNDRRATIDNLE